MLKQFRTPLIPSFWFSWCVYSVYLILIPFSVKLEEEKGFKWPKDSINTKIDKEHLVEECEVLHPEQLHRDHQGQARPAVTSNLAHGQKLHPSPTQHLGAVQIASLKNIIFGKCI